MSPLTLVLPSTLSDYKIMIRAAHHGGLFLICFVESRSHTVLDDGYLKPNLLSGSEPTRNLRNCSVGLPVRLQSSLTTGAQAASCAAKSRNTLDASVTVTCTVVVDYLPPHCAIGGELSFCPGSLHVWQNVAVYHPSNVVASVRSHSPNHWSQKHNYFASIYAHCDPFATQNLWANLL